MITFLGVDTDSLQPELYLPKNVKLLYEFLLFLFYFDKLTDQPKNKSVMGKTKY